MILEHTLHSHESLHYLTTSNILVQMSRGRLGILAEQLQRGHRVALLCCVVGALVMPTFVMAKPTAQYPVRAIEALINQASETQLITEYELGSVNWSTRVMQTLGVGTHLLLSPTGGWGQRELEEVAVDMTKQRFERLALELYQSHLRSGRCTWGRRAQLFQSSGARRMSDGTVHLPSVIRFAIFESCQRDHGVSSLLNEKNISTGDLISLLREFEEKRREEVRSIVFAQLKQSPEAMKCLATLPTLSLKHQDWPETPLKWRAIRWLKKDQAGKVSSLYSVIQPSHHLGTLHCRQEALGRFVLALTHQPKQFTQLNEALESERGIELWIWLTH